MEAWIPMDADLISLSIRTPMQQLQKPDCVPGQEVMYRVHGPHHKYLRRLRWPKHILHEYLHWLAVQVISDAGETVCDLQMQAVTRWSKFLKCSCSAPGQRVGPSFSTVPNCRRVRARLSISCCPRSICPSIVTASEDVLSMGFGCRVLNCYWYLAPL